MSRTRRILGGTSLGYVHQAAVTIVGLWLTPFLLHRLGQDDLGLWLVAGQLLNYLGLLDLGVIAMLPREVAFAAGRDATAAAGDRTADVVAQVRRIVRWQLPVLGVVCTLVLFFLPAEWLSLTRPLAVVLVAFVALYPSRILVSALQGLQDLSFLATVQIIGWVLATIATVALLVAGAGLYALVAAWVISQAVPAAAAWFRLRSVRPDLLQRRGGPPVAGARTYFDRSIWVSVAQLAQLLVAGSDVLLIGKLLGAAAVVPYVLTGKLVAVFANHPQLLMHAAQPALSELRASESRARLSNVATALTQCMLFMSGGVAVLILAVNHSFVHWWVGTPLYGGRMLTVAFVAMMLFRHWSVAVTYTLFCFGHERRISLTTLADGIVTVVAALILIRLFGPVGAPLASIVGVVAVSLPVTIHAVAREMGVGLGRSMIPVVSCFARIVPIAAFATFLSARVGNASSLGAVGVAALVGVVYLAVMWPLLWNGPVAPYLRSAFPLLHRIPRRSLQPQE